MVGTFKLGIVGSGGIARTHAGAGATGAQIAAVCDVNAQVASDFAQKFGGRSFDTTSDLFGEIDVGSVAVDGMLIATPPDSRVDVIESCVSRGIPCLIEKPLSATMEDARRIVEIAAAGSTVVATAYCHRFTPSIVKMRQLIGEELIGRPTRFENVFAFHHPPMATRWMSDPEVSGGGSLIDTGSHSVDLFRYLIGDGQVSAALADYAWDGRGESSATLLLRATAAERAGCAGVILAGWMEPARFQVSVIGDAGSLSYDYDKPEQLVHRLADGSTTIIAVETHELRFKRQLEAFFKACRGDALAVSELASVEDGLAAASLIADAYESLLPVRR